ncbi:hypothetical protein, partial [Blautia faecis]|uniref:hypothetical protein n=2 Tax=Blautia TaxID=572511 RepID=UPI001A9B9062
NPLLPKVAGMNESSCGVWKPRLYSRKRIRRGGFTYKNMGQDRRKSKSGKELKKYIDSYTLNAISWGTAKNDAKSLKDLLDVCTLDEETLRWAINTYKDTVSLEVKAYLLDAIGKAKKDEDVFDI